MSIYIYIQAQGIELPALGVARRTPDPAGPRARADAGAPPNQSPETPHGHPPPHQRYTPCERECQILVLTGCMCSDVARNLGVPHPHWTHAQVGAKGGAGIPGGWGAKSETRNLKPETLIDACAWGRGGYSGRGRWARPSGRKGAGAGGNAVVYWVHPAPFTRHPTPDTRHPTPDTLTTEHGRWNMEHGTRNPKHQPLDPQSSIFNPKPEIPNLDPEPQNRNTEPQNSQNHQP